MKDLTDKQVALVSRLMTQLGAHEESIRELAKVVEQLPPPGYDPAVASARSQAVEDLHRAARALSDATDALEAYRDNNDGCMDDDIGPEHQS
jgi:hypothetical protein